MWKKLAGIVFHCPVASLPFVCPKPPSFSLRLDGTGTLVWYVRIPLDAGTSYGLSFVPLSGGDISTWLCHSSSSVALRGGGLP